MMAVDSEQVFSAYQAGGRGQQQLGPQGQSLGGAFFVGSFFVISLFPNKKKNFPTKKEFPMNREKFFVRICL
jgi:hypothetical protein